jgi:hypothetical protein
MAGEDASAISFSGTNVMDIRTTKHTPMGQYNQNSNDRLQQNQQNIASTKSMQIQKKGLGSKHSRIKSAALNRRNFNSNIH